MCDNFEDLKESLRKAKLLVDDETELQASPVKRKISDVLNKKIGLLKIDDHKKYLPFLLELQRIYVESLPNASPALKRFLGFDEPQYKRVNGSDLLFVQLHLLAEAAGNKEEKYFNQVRDGDVDSDNAASFYANAAFGERAKASQQARTHANNLLMSYYLREADPENLPRRIAEETPGDLTVEDYIAFHKNSTTQLNRDTYRTLKGLYSNTVTMGSAQLAPNCCFDKLIRPILSSLVHDVTALINENPTTNPNEMGLLNQVADFAEEVREFSAKMKILAAADHLGANDDILYQLQPKQFNVEQEKQEIAQQAQNILNDINKQWPTSYGTTAARVLGGLMLVVGLLLVAAAAASLFLAPAATATALAMPTLTVATKATIGGIGLAMAVIGGVTLFRFRDPSVKKATVKATNACAKQVENLKFEPEWQQNLKPQRV